MGRRFALPEDRLRDEAISCSAHAAYRDCFAEFILGPAGGRTRGLAMTVL
jgi:hypothetical protein